jgi:putative phosphoesterase
MRIALISDIHGNYIALEAVLADIQSQHVNQIICLGDAATVGLQPKETLDALRELDCVCIMGNHDAALLDLARAADFHIAAPLVPTLEWGRQFLSPADLDFLRSFLPTYQLDLGNALSMLCFHGSPRSNTDLILSTTADEVVDGFFAGHSADLLAGGHSHIQMLRQRNHQVILNPGSVGNAFLHPFTPGSVPSLLPWAEYALVNVENGGWSADLRRVRFDAKAVVRLARASGSPSRDWWLDQFPE